MDISDITSYLQGIDEIRKDNNKTRDCVVYVTFIGNCFTNINGLNTAVERECEFGVGEVGKGQIDQGMWTQKTKMLKATTILFVYDAIKNGCTVCI
ncbi:14896_t:CDS:2 [Entrophospora sp. SA101]|nr:14896_t:CDS:2 [Entrophospora sp. SA101]CAJ0846205.1 17492_t:CDS:2 [Entrophospora sp. SA101]CAJ0846251.1 17508_t:CDS:2 [Entrophospora sp. SA101]